MRRKEEKIPATADCLSGASVAYGNVGDYGIEARDIARLRNAPVVDVVGLQREFVRMSPKQSRCLTMTLTPF